MSVVELRELAHKCIESIDDKYLLEEVLRLLNGRNTAAKESEIIYLSKEGLKALDDAEVEAKIEGNSFTLEETKSYFEKWFKENQ